MRIMSGDEMSRTCKQLAAAIGKTYVGPYMMEFLGTDMAVTFTCQEGKFKARLGDKETQIFSEDGKLLKKLPRT